MRTNRALLLAIVLSLLFGIQYSSGQDADNLLEIPYVREHLINNYDNILLNGKMITFPLTYLDAKNIKSVKVSERERIVYITQENKETSYFSLNDIDLSALSDEIKDINEIKVVSMFDNGSYAGDYNSSVKVENSVIDSLTIVKSYDAYQLKIWMNGQNSYNECLSYYDEDMKKIVFTHSQIMPIYPGGDAELLRYITENINLQAQDEIWGKVLLAFIVDDDGSIKHIKVIKNSIKGENSETKYEYKTEDEYTSNDREFVRVLKTMQRWTPAVCNGRYVPSRFSVPIRVHPSR